MHHQVDLLRQPVDHPIAQPPQDQRRTERGQPQRQRAEDHPAQRGVREQPIVEREHRRQQQQREEHHQIEDSLGQERADGPRC